MAEPSKPLPADLEAFLGQGMARGHGGVYVSMGTAARLTQQEMRSLSQALSALPNPVLWKVSAVQLPSKLALTHTNMACNLQEVHLSQQEAQACVCNGHKASEADVQTDLLQQESMRAVALGPTCLPVCTCCMSPSDAANCRSVCTRCMQRARCSAHLQGTVQSTYGAHTFMQRPCRTCACLYGR